MFPESTLSPAAASLRQGTPRVTAPPHVDNMNQISHTLVIIIIPFLPERRLITAALGSGSLQMHVLDTKRFVVGRCLHARPQTGPDGGSDCTANFRMVAHLLK